ncbi:hypothetical protein GCM10027060_24240 [Nesterenkonia halophila]
MSRRIDRAARRREIVEAHLRLIARDGMQAATTRALTAELGVARGALWHYFSSFDELLSETFRMVFERTNARIEERVADHDGVAGLLAMLDEIQPGDKTTHDEAFVVVSFWGRVPSNPELAVRQAAVVDSWRRGMLARTGAAVEAGELRPQAPQAEIVDTLLVLNTGGQVEHVLGTPQGDGARLRRLAVQVLEPWLTDAGRAAAAVEPSADAGQA